MSDVTDLKAEVLTLRMENAKLRDQLTQRRCRLVKEHFGHSGGAYRMVCSECHHLVWDGMGLQEKPRYCAFCGAEVER